MSGTFTCLDCGEGFRDVSALWSHSKARQHGLYQGRKPFSFPHDNKSYDPGDLSYTLAQKHDSYQVDMPYGRTTVFLPASRTAVASVSALNDAAAAGAARATFDTAPATTYPPGDPAMECRCEICDLSFRSDNELNTHYKWSPVHPSCGKCAKCFRDKSQLSRHLQTAHACDICVCGVIFEINHASVHYKASSCHPKCINCGAAFKDAPALNVHYRSSHYDHYCLRCDLWYPTKPDLQRHFFECSAHPRCFQCKEGFVGHVEYFQHVAAVHNSKVVAISKPPQKNKQEKPPPYRCDHCNLGFKKSKQLKKHNRQTPLHPCCTQCNKAYAMYGPYERHMINKHPRAEILPKLPPRPSPQTAGTGASASNCETATAVPEVVDVGDPPVESSVKPQVLVDAPIRDAEATASAVYHLPAAVNVGPSGETGRDAGTLTQTMLEQEYPVKTPEVNLGSDTGSVISFDSLASTSSESDALFAQARALSNTAVQCEDVDEREDTFSDAYEYIHANERSTDVNARAIDERPDSVISYVTDVDSAVMTNPELDFIVFYSVGGKCIVREIAESMKCPVCNKLFLLRLQAF
ncbi:uncharacterized protein B0H18DRAFT_952390 [Fomitopsis serialis]|uniref:uncharacterized protein n=1 Tax=Fomitopsis serialis TaxID=139415 RepID=UPI002008D3E5|nr:uncharacterized protein B0H18DRAFT_952390 [Neoantrodia serialis]KAH9932254.1 hypothetical protein B0H18DRAFT_952390 [Neoantrodia serialis]